jgi:hypothetical protein
MCIHEWLCTGMYVYMYVCAYIYRGIDADRRITWMNSYTTERYSSTIVCVFRQCVHHRQKHNIHEFPYNTERSQGQAYSFWTYHTCIYSFAPRQSLPRWKNKEGRRLGRTGTSVYVCTYIRVLPSRWVEQARLCTYIYMYAHDHNSMRILFCYIKRPSSARIVHAHLNCIVCACLYIHIHTRARAHTHRYIDTHMYACMYVYNTTHTHICIYTHNLRFAHVSFHLTSQAPLLFLPRIWRWILLTSTLHFSCLRARRRYGELACVFTYSIMHVVWPIYHFSGSYTSTLRLSCLQVQRHFIELVCMHNLHHFTRSFLVTF